MSEYHLPTKRIFQTGATRISEDDSLRSLNHEEVRNILKRAYPEVTNATIRERTLDDGSLLIEFIPAPGRKG
jgi:PRTRC genetic system protein C